VRRTLVSLLFVVYLLVVIKLVLLKGLGDLKSHFVEDYNLGLLNENIAQGNYIPFYTVKYYMTGTDNLRYTKENLVGNVLLFFPFGVLLPVLFNNVNGFRRLISISLVISLALELIQLFTALGNFDVDDIILNVFGASLGFGTYILANEFITVNRRPHISE
jgi:glycopeptide antibiotics resistance protein